MLKRTFLVVLLAAICVSNAIPQQADVPIQPPADYQSDGCSMFPDGDYRECCIAHDRDYFVGGTEAERRASDKRLAKCVRGKGHRLLSGLMFLGVRIGGVSFLPTPFRWGFGQKREK
jgi:hypothetical protein